MMRRLAALAVTAGLAWPLSLPADPYRLHAQDRLLIRVLTWDFSQNSLIGWQDMSGEYSLSPEGMLQLPLAGEVAAEGLTQAELAVAISDLLRRRAGLDEAPNLSIELVSSIPVYVLGDVESRGAVAFRPGLTARQALALAGGVYRTAVGDPVRSAAAAAELRAAEDALARLLAERQALHAELAMLRPEADAAPPADASAAVGGAQGRLQQADQAARQVRLESYDKLRVGLRERAERLNRQLELRDQQIASTREELDGITSLNERGLAVNARVTSLAIALSDHESKRIELETALLLLEEQRNQAERDSSTLVADAVVERLRRLTTLEGEIAAAELQRDAAGTQAALLGAAAAGGVDDAGADIGFLLTRGGETAPADANAKLLPGDTLDVVLGQAATPAPQEAP